ncbi:MAG: replication-relaxation family protein [Oscillochloridaceae bacterium umkhey_bin13]
MSLTPRLRMPSPILPASEREIAVLRLLGRLHIVMGQTIRVLIYPDQHENTCRNALHGLAERKLIWQGSVPLMNEAGRSRGRAPHVYGLTDDGRTLLGTLGAEPYDGTFGRLLSRSKQAPLPPQATLTSESYLSWWCASLIEHLRCFPLLAGLHIQHRYPITDPEGNILQTVGALMSIAFDRDQTTVDRPQWVIPWLTDGALSSSWTIVHLAIELDTGIMSMRSIVDLAQTYRRLTETRIYQQNLGRTNGFRPVIITPSGHRARAFAEAWMSAWPGSPALVSSVERTAHADHGVLWGTYFALRTNPVQPTSLLGTLLGTIEEWERRMQGVAKQSQQRSKSTPAPRGEGSG